MCISHTQPWLAISTACTAHTCDAPVVVQGTYDSVSGVAAPDGGTINLAPVTCEIGYQRSSVAGATCTCLGDGMRCRLLSGICEKNPSTMCTAPIITHGTF